MSSSHNPVKLRAIGAQSPVPELRPGRPTLTAILAAIISIVSVVILMQLPSSWHQDNVLFALMLVSLTCFLASSRPRHRLYFDLSDAPAIAALVILGPLPAALVFLSGDLVEYAIDRYRINAFLTNTAGALVGLVVAGVALDAIVGVPTDSLIFSEYLLLIPIGLSMSLISYALWMGARWLGDGAPLRDFGKTHVVLLVAVSCAVVVSCTSLALYFATGAWALLLQAPILIAIGVAIPRASRDLAPERMLEPEVTRIYALAIGDILDLNRRQRRILRSAAENVGASVAPTDLRDFNQVMTTILYSSEKWDGKDSFPGVVSGELIPLESRVLAVARAWSEVTAGENAMSADDALRGLAARSGTDFDPTVVAAAMTASKLGSVPRRPEMWVQLGTERAVTR